MGMFQSYKLMTSYMRMGQDGATSFFLINCIDDDDDAFHISVVKLN